MPTAGLAHVLCHFNTIGHPFKGSFLAPLHNGTVAPCEEGRRRRKQVMMHSILPTALASEPASAPLLVDTPMAG